VKLPVIAQWGQILVEIAAKINTTYPYQIWAGLILNNHFFKNKR
jgi:hypothetical protein